MPSKNGKTYGGPYVPAYVFPNLKWYERDRLMTYIDQLKYSSFAENPDRWLRNHKVVNFYIIVNEE